jgi:hypothetical protein
LGHAQPATAQRLKLLNQVRHYLMAPDRKDPLSIGNEEILDAVFADRKNNVVACLPDRCMRAYGDETTVDRFLLQAPNLDLSVTNDTGWIVLKPLSYPQHWLLQSDRQAMKTYAAILAATGKIEIDPYATFAAKCGQQSFHRYLELLIPNKSPLTLSIQTPGYAWTKLYASFSQAQKDAIKAGRTIAYKDLSREQQRLSALIVYGRIIGLHKWDHSLSSNLDPTEELPNGLLQGAGISGSIRRDRVVVFHDSQTQDRDLYEITLDGWDRGLWFTSGNPLRPAGGPENMLFDIQSRGQVTLNIYFSADHCTIGTFEELYTPNPDKPLPLPSLPKDVQEKLKPMIKMFFPVEVVGGDGRGNPPPPLESLGAAR